MWPCALFMLQMVAELAGAHPTCAGGTPQTGDSTQLLEQPRSDECQCDDDDNRHDEHQHLNQPLTVEMPIDAEFPRWL
jgi:hypothetical protein